jgi:uncharacterized protein (TIGR02001 family)
MRGNAIKTTLVAGAFSLLLGATAMAADYPVKAAKAPPPPAVPDFDIAFGGSIASDYLFRGITQSNHGPSGSAYFEPRFMKNLFYVGIAASGIDWPTAYGLNSPSAEIDLYAGVRPVFGPVTVDLGVIYYWYPNPAVGTFRSDFVELYAKPSWTVNDTLTLGANAFYSPSLLNYGAPSWYLSGTAKVTFPSSMFPPDWGMYISGELGHFWVGTTSNLPFVNANPPPIGFYDIPDYNTWNIGVGFTFKDFTLDLRYSGTDLSKFNCAQFWVAPAVIGAAANPVTNYCDNRFFAKLSFDSLLSHLK